MCIQSQRARRYSLRRMFLLAESFNHPIGDWNTGSVDIMAGLCNFFFWRLVLKAPYFNA